MRKLLPGAVKLRLGKPLALILRQYLTGSTRHVLIQPERKLWRIRRHHRNQAIYLSFEVTNILLLNLAIRESRRVVDRPLL